MRIATPFVFSADLTYDVLWLGGWPNGAAMGAGEALYMTQGEEVANAFESAADCSSHAQYAEVVQRQPAGPPPTNGVALFTDCKVHDGRTVPEALDAVPAEVLDAATAVGYRPLVRIVKVELPLAIPVLIASLRVVAVTNISMVSVGSVIGIGGLGTWFTEGYQANKSDQIVAGIIAIFVLAVVIDTLIMLAGKALTPWARAGRPSRVKAVTG